MEREEGYSERKVDVGFVEGIEVGAGNDLVESGDEECGVFEKDEEGQVCDDAAGKGVFSNA